MFCFMSLSFLFRPTLGLRFSSFLQNENYNSKNHCGRNQQDEGTAVYAGPWRRLN